MAEALVHNLQQALSPACKNNKNGTSDPRCNPYWRRLLCTILVGCGLMFLMDALEWDTTTGDVQFKLHTGIRSKTNETHQKDPDTINHNSVYSSECQNACAKEELSNFTRHFDGQDLTSSKLMLDRLLSFRQKWINQLKQEYGDENYYNIFEPIDDDTGKPRNVGDQRAFVDPNRLPNENRGERYEDVKDSEGPAWSRMIRKWTIKVLQVQLGILQAQQLDFDETGCLEECHQSGVPRKSTPTSSTTAGLFSKFTWVNGGHSASAGHGNFYRESYTAILGRDLQPILKEIGLDFQVRNYAMGGTESGEEVGLCFNSVFGKDVDSISWDYGMTDGHEYWKTINYAYNAARLALLDDTLSQPGNIRHRPSLWFFHLSDGQNPVLQSLQSLGLPILAMDTRFKKDKIISAVPDTFGKSDAEIEAMPPYVQYFKCQEQIEAGEPGCNDYKFNHTVCAERTGQNSWHPGWRYHALMGHMLALTVLELIAQSLHKLIALEPSQPETPEQRKVRLLVHLLKLDAMEQQDYDNIFLSRLPSDLKQWFEDYMWKGDRRETNREAMRDFPIETMVKDAHFCHTAMLPAEIRYKGLLTENFDETGIALDYQQYERGVMFSDIMKVETAENKSVYIDHHAGHKDQMVMGSNADDFEDWCEELTRIDHKDYFYISSEQGWRKLTLPNNAEKRYYTEFNTETSKGWILICMAECWWGNCADGDIKESVVSGSMDAGEYGQIKIKVNDIDVTGINCMNKCCALKHDDPDPKQQFIWKPNAEGAYEFQTKIENAIKYSYARFSSFIFL